MEGVKNWGPPSPPLALIEEVFIWIEFRTFSVNFIPSNIQHIIWWISLKCSKLMVLKSAKKCSNFLIKSSVVLSFWVKKFFNENFLRDERIFSVIRFDEEQKNNRKEAFISFDQKRDQIGWALAATAPQKQLNILR